MSYLKIKLKDRVKSILQEHPKARENNNFFMVLGHEFKNVQCFLRRGETNEELATTELINFGAKIPKNNGFSIKVYIYIYKVFKC